MKKCVFVLLILALLMACLFAQVSCALTENDKQDAIEERLRKAFSLETYSIETLYQLKMEWLPYMDEINVIVNALKAKGKLPQYTPIMSHVNTLEKTLMPTSEDITADEALQIARDSILLLEGWSEEQLDMFVEYLQIYYHSEELDRDIYQFAFTQKSCFSKEYYDYTYEYFEKDYCTPLYALFGGDNASTPYYVSIRIDAKTGEVAETPWVQYPPVELNVFDLIR